MSARSRIAVGCLLAAACTSASKPAGDDTSAKDSASAEVGDARGRLQLALPAWAKVAVDGEARAADASVELPVGPHEVSVTTVCGELPHRVEIAAAKTTTVRAHDVPGLSRAPLKLQVRTADGKPLQATVTLQDAYGKQVAQGEGLETAVPPGGEAIEVPACRLRMTVKASGQPTLGAFIEDVALKGAETLTRQVVLVPGPDLVRIHGGAFVSGPPPGQLERYAGPSGIYENVAHEVTTFDIDRHEVTVADFQACVKAGGCDVDVARANVTEWAHEGARDECNVVLGVSPTRELAYLGKKDREGHPVDCLAMWEAELYCKWAGKRLPTSVEWEFAARSRTTQYMWPWGSDESKCRAHTTSTYHKPKVCPRREGTTEVCSYPEGNSEQGVCDFVGNVSEWTTYPEGHPHSAGAGQRGGTYEEITEPFKDVFIRRLETLAEERYRQAIAVGFRCARGVEEGAE